MKRQCVFMFALVPLLIAGSGMLVVAQTERALERRLDRNARQMQRQANRSMYFGDKTWNEISPWVQQYQIAPVRRAAGAAAATADAVADTAARVGNRVGNAAARTADPFGFRDNNAGAQWFYDYYTYRPTYYYSQPDGGERYLGAIRYFDRDNDGIYESNAYYRDSDNDGVYDEYNRYDFDAVEEVDEQVVVENRAEQNVDTVYQGPADSKRYQVSGEIAMTKSAEVNGNEHLLVAVKQQQGTLAIDLGPAAQMEGQQVEVGARIEATGPLEQIGEKRILMAESATVNGQRLAIDRQVVATLRGDIVDIRQVEIGNAPHYMAIIESDGDRHLVDLGATTSYQTQIQTGSPVVVYGVPVQSHGYRVVMANRVQMGQDMVRVNRSESFSF